MVNHTDGTIEKPQVIAFEVTRRCRFACQHCRANAGQEKGGELSTAQCKNILKGLADYTKCMVIITGGEPMERSDIYEIIQYGDSLGLRMVLATCGYLITQESIEKLKESGIKALSLSLDGASPHSHDAFRGSEGAYDAVMKAAGIARKAEMRFQINTTICRSNLEEFTAIAEVARRIGASCFNPFILIPTGRGSTMGEEILDPVEYERFLNELLRIKSETQIDIRVTCGPQFARIGQQQKNKTIMADCNGCLGGTGFGFISFCGDVQTCGFLDIPAGNLIENGYDFETIWVESSYLNQIRNRNDFDGKCSECDFIEYCGGCRARAYAVNGDYLASDPICAYQKGRH